MATTTDIKNGLCINFNNDIYTIVEFLHVKPGKGAAFVRTKMRNVKTGRMLENTFPSGAKIDIVRVERRPYTYLYKEGDMHVFMHTETYEQIYIPEQIINAPQFLKDGQYVEITVVVLGPRPSSDNCASERIPEDTCRIKAITT